MNYEVNIKKEQTNYVNVAGLLSGLFLNDVTFQLSKDLKGGRGKLMLFSPFYIVWETEPFIPFLLLS